MYPNGIKFVIQAIVFIRTANHFTAEIFKLDREKGILKKKQKLLL